MHQPKKKVETYITSNPPACHPAYRRQETGPKEGRMADHTSNHTNPSAPTKNRREPYYYDRRRDTGKEGSFGENCLINFKLKQLVFPQSYGLISGTRYTLPSGKKVEIFIFLFPNPHARRPED
jgi:hypothetical protein